MKIHFCGAAGTTTGSQHLLEINGKRILLDCGLFQGHRADELRINRDFPYFDPASIDCVILSHAHIDHSGNIPNLVKKGYNGPIYCTSATRSLCSLMLQDAARIQAHDCAYLNKMHKRKGGTGSVAEAIYTEDDARRSMRKFVTIEYENSIRIADGVALTFYDAGHILGAAQIVLDIEDAEDNGKKKRLLFSGDIGRGNNELLCDPVAVKDVDIMLMESTYGGRRHDAPARDDEAFFKAITTALERGGNVYIPAFAVERTQQLLYLLKRAFQAGLLRNTQVYVDSPMATDATSFFRSHPECLKEDLYNSLSNNQDPFSFANLHMYRTVSESQSLNKVKRGAIIISASGMCEAGRIVHHLAQGISTPVNTVLFVGFCAQHTLGRRIMDGAQEVSILGCKYPVRAQICTLDSFSGHADHEELLAYFKRTGGSKQQVFLVHGEPNATKALHKSLCASHEGHIHIAEQNQIITC